MSFELSVQQAVFTALSGVISCQVYDDAPYQTDGLPLDQMTFVVIGNDTFVPFDTDETLGAEMTVTLHVWSRYPGMKQVKTILGEIYDALNRATLTATGYDFIDCLHEFSETKRASDGETRHGVTRYRITLREAA